MISSIPVIFFPELNQRLLCSLIYAPHDGDLVDMLLNVLLIDVNCSNFEESARLCQAGSEFLSIAIRLGADYFPVAFGSVDARSWELDSFSANTLKSCIWLTTKTACTVIVRSLSRAPA